MAQNRTINGILPAPATVASKKPNPTMSLPKAKMATPKLRLIIRRLPPGLTQAEFEQTLGDEWRVGAGKVEWMAYKEGKASKDPAKPSRPGRAYLRVKDQPILDGLSSLIKQSSFEDAKKTAKDSCLLGPPLLEFAPYGKIPSGRVRGDARQGTIDQDQEFIDFLQSLTEPATKASMNTEADDSKGKVKTTPLIQYLRDKKANKFKEAAAVKAAKNQPKPDSKTGKVEKMDPKKVTVIKKEAHSPGNKSKTDKQELDSAKGAKSTPGIKSKTDSTPPSPSPSASAIKSPKRERERGSISVAAKMLQRDLGLASPKNDRRVSRGGSAVGRGAASHRETAQPAVEAINNPTAPASSPSPIASSPAPPIRPPTGPRITKNPSPQTSAGQAPIVPARTPRSAPAPSSGARSAFLKHANFSQGVTDDLLQAAFSVFGPISRCEIDKKKGFGYVDFEEPEGLKAAMLASPVKVGDKGGQVVVLENRNIKLKAAPGPVNSPTPPASAPTLPQPNPTSTPNPERITSPLASETPNTVTSPPTAPRGAMTPRGRGGHHPRGTFSQSPRGGFSRGGRGGRAGFRGRGGNLQSSQAAPSAVKEGPSGVAPATNAPT